MDRQYDVIVVGAGNGGLVAAANCAKHGLKTLLLEKHNIPGGCATSFVRGRFEFEPSLHELCSVGTPEHPDTVYKIFEDLGAKVDWRYENNMYRVIARGENGYDVTVKGGIDGYCDSIEAACPGSRESVKAFLDLVVNCKQAIEYITKKKGNPNKLVMALKYGNFMRCASHSVEEVQIALGMPEKARNIVNTYWGYLGVPTDELNCMHYLTMVNGYVKDGAAMPAKRSHELSESLIKVFQDKGGEVWYNSEVTEFLTDESGRINGVVANGEKIFAKEIISNVIPNNVYSRMDEKKVPENDLKLANARDFGISLETVYIGCDCSAEELGVKDYTVFVVNDPNPRVQHDTRGLYIVNSLNKVVPESSPKGTCTLFFTYLCYGSDIPKDLKPEEYKKWKNAHAEKYIKDYEELMGIDIRSHIEEISVATPVTFARYLGTPDGTIYGYKLSGWDHLMSRTAHVKADFTIPGLTFVGGHSSRGDGYSSAYIIGYQHSNQVINRLKGGN